MTSGTTEQTFTAELQLNGKTATGIEVPAEVVEAFGTGRRPKVRVHLGELSYETTLGVMGGRTLISVSAERRQAAGLTAGDVVQVRLELL